MKKFKIKISNKETIIQCRTFEVEAVSEDAAKILVESAFKNGVYEGSTEENKELGIAKCIHNEYDYDSSCEERDFEIDTIEQTKEVVNSESTEPDNLNVLLLDYSDVTIHKITGQVNKLYAKNTKNRVAEFYYKSSKNFIYFNIRWNDEEFHRNSRMMNFLSTYKKTFNEKFTGSIYCEDIDSRVYNDDPTPPTKVYVTLIIENGKIIN